MKQFVGTNIQKEKTNRKNFPKIYMIKGTTALPFKKFKVQNKYDISWLLVI